MEIFSKLCSFRTLLWVTVLNTDQNAKSNPTEQKRSGNFEKVDMSDKFEKFQKGFPSFWCIVLSDPASIAMSSLVLSSFLLLSALLCCHVLFFGAVFSGLALTCPLLYCSSLSCVCHILCVLSVLSCIALSSLVLSCLSCIVSCPILSCVLLSFLVLSYLFLCCLVLPCIASLGQDNTREAK